MDPEQELAKFKSIMIVGIIFLFSAYFSWKEFKYLIWGKTAQVTIVRIVETEEIGRRGRSIPKLGIEYTFTDADGNPWRERDDVPLSWSGPKEGDVQVEYLPRVKDSSRLSGHANRISVYIFFGSLAFAAYFFYQLTSDPDDRKNKKKQRKSR